MKRGDFAHRWVQNILLSIDGQLNEGTKARLMESCGRACARSSVIEEAEACRGDLDAFLAKIRSWVGQGNVTVDGETIRVVYEECFCKLTTEIPRELAVTYCLCSCGWLKEMFETVVGRPVEVDLESSIRRGSDTCSFVVRLV